MTREEAIKILEHTLYCVDEETPKGANEAEAIPMAIEALKREQPDEWCTDCTEYDTEKKCCPRFNKVIREAMKRIPHDDGTLEVKVEDATKVGRVLISDDKHRGGLYYPDEDEPQGDLISREAAKDIAFRSPFFSDALTEELDALPSADRPQGHWIDMADFEQCSECHGTHLKEVDTYYGKATWIKTDFCPNCGADMRGDNE